MPGTDIQLEAMLRHLGAAYYDSLHGSASRSDVSRALDTVEEHLNEPSKLSQEGLTPPPRLLVPHARRWTRQVSDVMTMSVVSVERMTPYKEIVRALTEHDIGGVPVLSAGRHVVGVVTEGDLLAEEDKAARDAAADPAHTAGELMTSPAVTIHPEATIPGAARTMNAHQVRRLPVVDDDGRLIGIVSRRDLLGVFLRPDDDIATEVRQIFDEVLHAGSAAVTITVKNGVVILTGNLAADPGMVAIAIRLAWTVDGVVDVVDRSHAFSGEEMLAALEPVPLARASLRAVGKMLGGHEAEGFVQPACRPAVDVVCAERVDKYLARRRAAAERLSDERVPDARAAG